jgi:hypothetical protein
VVWIVVVAVLVVHKYDEDRSGVVQDQGMLFFVTGYTTSRIAEVLSAFINSRILRRQSYLSTDQQKSQLHHLASDDEFWAFSRNGPRMAYPVRFDRTFESALT